MQPPVLYKIADQTFWLSPMRAVYWEEEKALILSDLHFGKTGHFRKAGIAVPQDVFKEDLQRLLNLLHYFSPTQIIAVGDLFHSHANLELEMFKRWRSSFPSIAFHLVKGNHDILTDAWYAEAGLTLWPDSLTINNIRFTHDVCEPINNTYSFCGHLHPGIVINGLAKQSLRFPCFYFTPQHCILPAFSKFTGVATVKPKPNDAVFAIVENSLVQIK